MDYSNLRQTITDPKWSESQENILMEPYIYISQNPGKEIRSKLIDAFNQWLEVDKDDLKVITKVVRMLHNASLLMDDVEDNSELRRGLPVAHAIYGVPQTINAANYVYFLAFQELLQLRSGVMGKGKDKELDLVVAVNEELLQLHRGQGMDLFWRDSLTCPTEKEYIDMVLGKAGGLLRLAVKLMMAKSDSNVDYVPLVNLISVWFQIRDDYMNLQSPAYKSNKGFCEDLTEGKFSFPVVHGVRADTSNRQILNVLQKRTSSTDLKQHIVDYLDNHTKSFHYTRKVLTELEAQIMEEIKVLGGNEKLENVVLALSLEENEEHL
ncbi:geranylgeranyl diphosphate synthase, type III [Cryptococcus neoformans]|nr:geranylgeranyl diphosphate synthase, type III [Cryptococcus neoformans var. grubii 125.91]OXG47141.1 geranylgeranyl diphosphate synthase, type III [Cryptococcus neoformans var. grubii Th84]OXH04835.1 geranylgeranyl diphosphate synthase, type III [Cryptococcus neoformans var. grubii]OXH26450.1 geranylgeranyl diphosphate synthase, type III [Cryptococcus neoformans var. grubii]OXH46157.1 geranylgeranyl diphosphate synthase, type III [Cryptococcus neoformans var. grubii]